MTTRLTRSHFELFALPEQYTLDHSVLDERYRELQRHMHPDNYASASDQERRLSIQHAAQINEAYETLKDPVKRGRYLLELRGHGIEEEKSTTRDSAFLMRQMELREALDAVREQSDPLAALDRLAAQVRSDISALESGLATLLDNGQPGHMQEAAEYVLKMQFFNRLQNEINELEAELEDELY